jgi:hypothetical protein
MAWKIPRRGSPSVDATQNVHEPWIPKESIDYFSAPALIQTGPGSHNESPYNEQALPTKYIHPRRSIQKYSLRWFSREWDRKFKVGIWPRVIYAITGILALSAWMGFMCAILLLCTISVKLTGGSFTSIFFAKDEAHYQIAPNKVPIHPAAWMKL